MRGKYLLTAAAFAAALVCSQMANAAVTVVSNTSSVQWFDQLGDFVEAAVGARTDTLDNLGMGPVRSPITRHVGDYSYTIAADGGLWAAGDGRNRYVTTSEIDSVITLDNFSAGTRAVGGNFFNTDFNGDPIAAGAVQMTVVDRQGTLVLRVTGGISDSFVGFLASSALQSVTVQSRLNDYFTTIDNITLAAPVPEPGSAAMLLAGLAVLPWAARRRVRRS